MALGARLGIEHPNDDGTVETALNFLEEVTGAATTAVTESSADAIRLRRSLDTLPLGLVLCDEAGTVIYRNTQAESLMTNRYGDALAAQAVTELLDEGWRNGLAERTIALATEELSRIGIIDAGEVLERIDVPAGVSVSVLVPNERGLDDALALRDRNRGDNAPEWRLEVLHDGTAILGVDGGQRGLGIQYRLGSLRSLVLGRELPR